MTIPILIALFGIGCFVLLILAVLEMNRQRTQDQDWHFCAWCREWWNESTGSRCLVTPPNAPLVDGQISHGICNECVGKNFSNPQQKES